MRRIYVYRLHVCPWQTPNKTIFLDNIKAREALLEEVKTDIRKRCKDRDVDVTGIFPLYSAREVKIVNKRFKGI